LKPEHPGITISTTFSHQILKIDIFHYKGLKALVQVQRFNFWKGFGLVAHIKSIAKPETNVNSYDN